MFLKGHGLGATNSSGKATSYNKRTCVVAMEKHRIYLYIFVFIFLTACGTWRGEQNELSPNEVQLGDTDTILLERVGPPIDTKTVLGPTRREEVLIYEYDTFTLLMSERQVIAIVSYSPEVKTKKRLGMNPTRNEVREAYSSYNIYSNNKGSFYVEMENDQWLVFGKNEFIYYGDSLLLTLAGGSFEQVNEQLELINKR